MRILGIETSCDETSVAIVKDGKQIEHHHTYSQIEHQDFMGVVPEIASRVHFEVLLPMIENALSETKYSWNDIDAIAVTQTPGLLGSLLVGFTFAKTLAYLLDKPLIPVNHLWGHLYAPLLFHDHPVFPYGGLVASGGHTLLALVHAFDKVEIIGSTIDDAIGECYDKVAKMLYLGYPGGAIIDQKAQNVSSSSHLYALAKIGLHKAHERYTFSYSGLKTSARRIIEKEQTSLQVNQFCFEFQHRAIEHLMDRVTNLILDYHLQDCIISGGVAMNSELRRCSKQLPCRILIPPPELCTDNAVMIAGLANFLTPLQPHEYKDLDVCDKVLSFEDKKKLRVSIKHKE